jgi:hypothetical protein
VRPPTPLKRLGYHEQAFRLEEPLRIDCTVRAPTLPNWLGFHEDAVGIKESVQEDIKLLEWESEKNETTLADAMFAGSDIVGCKYSKVRLFDDIISIPNILELQKAILRDLMMGREPDDGRTFESGQRAIVSY